MSYELKENEVKQVWPDNRLLTDFVSSRAAAKNIEWLVEDYFDQLPPLFDKVHNEVRKLSLSATRTLRELTRRLTEYKESMAIGGNFVRYVTYIT